MPSGIICLEKKWMSTNISTATQNHAKQQSAETDDTEKTEEPSSAAFESRWNRMFEELCHYKQENNDTNVPQEYPILGNWVKRQRQEFKNKNIPLHRIEKLLDLDFQFVPRTYSWKSMLQELIAYKETEGHLNVPQNYPANPLLGRWINTQRKEYKKYIENQPSQITERRIQVLEDMGFIFDLYEHSWQTMYQQLKEYIDTHGDSYVPKRYEENPVLGTWVQTQRTNYKLLTESPESIYFPKHRIDALNALDFVWDCYDTAWNERYAELVKYEADHGNCLVPFDYEPNISLGIWVSTQRQQYNLMQKKKPCKITPERVQKLDSIGFTWDVRETQWMERYEELVDFIEDYGHSKVPFSLATLRRWVDVQRRNYWLWKEGKTSRLTKERRELLDKVGFDWTLGKKSK